MKTFIRTSLAAVCLLAAVALAQDAPKSLVPAFGAAGREFQVKAKDGKIIKGWLPNEWVDNSEWAPVTATYSKLADGPKDGVTAVRIKLESVSDGQLQLSSWAGKFTYKKGVKYAVEGWVRSAQKSDFKVGIRQIGDPYEFYHEQELATAIEWKPFEFAFTPDTDHEGVVMFVMPNAGTVDLAGVVAREKK
ncbi:MAG: carbohydrate binding domain-containing protein [Verrucomicrobia bacterium]|nr:carbohydrate binding domain-containing protein [Verrucomicrobiota bacterium]